jgi:hypothetical protein
LKPAIGDVVEKTTTLSLVDRYAGSTSHTSAHPDSATIGVTVPPSGPALQRSSSKEDGALEVFSNTSEEPSLPTTAIEPTSRGRYSNVPVSTLKL